EEKDLKSYDLAYLLSGTFTSFFKGKAIPEKIMGEKDITQEDKTMDTKDTKANKAFEGFTAKHTFLETSRPAKLFVLPCSQMLQDNMLDPEGRSTNATFILNSIDHLNGEDNIARLRSKQQTLNPIAQTTPFNRGFIKAFNIIVLPILVILFGLGVLAKRTSRKKKIANRFNV
ncbi:MAG: ABC transporter permease, partial [Proteobacteria bacterium]|nr:ABC transporter permease [Pseudomonadota bacterium]